MPKSPELTRSQKQTLKRRFTRASKRVTPTKVGAAIDGFQNKYDELVDDGRQWLRATLQRAKLLQWLCTDWWNGDYATPYKVIAAAATALLYLISPLDLIPDVIPLIGLVDDAYVIVLAFKLLDEELDDYVDEMEIDVAEFDELYEVA